jgi:2-octaprenyl-6-methoxyphenol hydroxylase
MSGVVILGAGLSGMITALAFASKNINVLLLEKSNMQFPLDQRTTALTNKSKNLMMQIGLWDVLTPHISQLKDIYVLDNKAPEMIHFSEEDSKKDALGYMVENRHLRAALEKLTQAHPAIDLRLEVDYDIELKDDGCKVYAKDEVFDAELTVLCEGRNSALKKRYFTNSVDKSYKQSVLTMIICHDKAHEGTAVEHFMPQGVFAILPLCDPHQSSIVWAVPTKLASIYTKMMREELTPHLTDRVGEFLGKIEIISEVQSFPLSAAISKNYYYKRLVLVADSAHSIHPLSGQGLNQGMKDIEELVNLVSRNKTVGLNVDHTMLKEYENKRKLDNYAMYLITDNLNRFFCNNTPVLRESRRLGLSIIENFPIAKKLLVKYAAHSAG